jgi:hypothetical protein
LVRDASEKEYMRPLLAAGQQIAACYYCLADFSEVHEPELIIMMEGDGKRPINGVSEHFLIGICQQCAASGDVAINVNEPRRDGYKAMKWQHSNKKGNDDERDDAKTLGMAEARQHFPRAGRSGGAVAKGRLRVHGQYGR